MAISFDTFIKNHLGKGVDVDGAAGIQCVDLAKAYLTEVFGLKTGAWGNAHYWYDGFNSIDTLKKHFTRIPNTPDLVPKKGDIVVWKSSLSSGGWGHIAIASGEGDTTYFYSYDQNWTGRHDPCAKTRHNYNHVAGVLRPKKTDSKATDPVFKTGTYTLTVNLKVRTGVGTNYKQKLRSQLTADGKAHALNQSYAVLKSGTKVTVSLVEKKSAAEYWGKIPSGWICLMYNGSRYVK